LLGQAATLMKKFHAAAEKMFRRVHRTVSLWLTGDVSFAVLPLVVLAVITAVMNESFADFGLLKEWSFAAIVLYGTSVRRLIKLKVDIQNAPRSYKLDTGVQIQILMVIASVLTLALVILHEKGSLSDINTGLLSVLQLALFVFSVLSMLGLVIAEEYGTPIAYVNAGSWPRSSAVKVLAAELERTAGSLERDCHFLERATRITFKHPVDESSERVAALHADAELKAAVVRIQTLANEIAERSAAIGAK
jgi:hypothetical protein